MNKRRQIKKSFSENNVKNRVRYLVVRCAAIWTRLNERFTESFAFHIRLIIFAPSFEGLFNGHTAQTSFAG